MSPMPFKIFDPNKILKMLHTEYNFHDVPTTNCTKSLYQMDTTFPTVYIQLNQLSAKNLNIPLNAVILDED